jgi:hypothetical protein
MGYRMILVPKKSLNINLLVTRLPNPLTFALA